MTQEHSAYLGAPVSVSRKLQALVYDILPSTEEGARKRCSECVSHAVGALLKLIGGNQHSVKVRT